MTSTTTLQPAKPAYDPATATSVIAHWTNVWVRDIDVKLVRTNRGLESVECAEVTLTASTTREGRRLAALLDLARETADPSATWRTWSGWVSEPSARRHVLARVTAPIGVTRMAS